MKFLKSFLGFLFLIVGLYICIFSLKNGSQTSLFIIGIFYLTCSVLFFYLRLAPKKKQKNCYQAKPPSAQINNQRTLNSSESKFANFIFDENNSFIAKSDGSKILDEDIPFLISVGYENSILYEQNSMNPKFHRTELEKELDFHFFHKYMDQIAEYENAFQEEFNQATNEKDPKMKYKRLLNTKRLYEKAKAFCYSHGAEGHLYFDDTWEHLHNSKNECFSWIQQVDKELDPIDLSFSECSWLDVENVIRICQDCYRLINTTTNPETFFSRYELLLKHAYLLLVAGVIEQRHMNSLENDYDSIVKNFIDRYWTRTLEHIKSLKTINGKENNYNKFISSLDKYCNQISEDNRTYYHSLNYE